MFLTTEEVIDLTGYTWRNEQAKALAANNYNFDIRAKDGKILVLRSHIEQRLGGKPTKTQEKVYQPNFEGLRKHCNV